MIDELWKREARSDRRGAMRPLWRHEHGWIPGWWIDRYLVWFCKEWACTASRIDRPAA